MCYENYVALMQLKLRIVKNIRTILYNNFNIRTILNSDIYKNDNIYNTYQNVRCISTTPELIPNMLHQVLLKLYMS
jgi:hypothetical protein